MYSKGGRYLCKCFENTSREMGNKSIQFCIAISVYALTEKGKRLVLAYLTEFRDKLVVFRTSKLLFQAENRVSKLKTE